jgi:phenylacetate-CoA ligase
LFEDLAIVEVVDENYRPVPSGKNGDKVLITVLDRRTLPLIRYEVDDRIRMAASTGACGRPFALIEQVLGRTWDALHLLPALAGGEVTVQPLTFTAILDALPIIGWQVIHETDGTLTFLTGGAPDTFDEQIIIEQVEHALTTQGARTPPITVNRVKAIPRTAVGKAPLIRSTRRSLVRVVSSSTD